MKKTLILVVLAIASLTVAKSQEKNFIDQPFIEVTGFADTLIVPNEIFLNIVINEMDFNNKKRTVEEFESKMIAGLKKLGINVDEDLSMSDMLSNYKSTLLKRNDVVKSKEYTLKVSDAQLAAKVFIMLEEEGISNTTISRVNHTNLEGLRNACRSKAIVNAHKAAIALTAPLSQSIGNAIFIQDYSQNNFPAPLQGRLAGVRVESYSLKMSDTEQVPNIEFEKIKISVSINVRFLLK